MNYLFPMFILLALSFIVPVGSSDVNRTWYTDYEAAGESYTVRSNQIGKEYYNIWKYVYKDTYNVVRSNTVLTQRIEVECKADIIIIQDQAYYDTGRVTTPVHTCKAGDLLLVDYYNHGFTVSNGTIAFKVTTHLNYKAEGVRWITR